MVGKGTTMMIHRILNNVEQQITQKFKLKIYKKKHKAYQRNNSWHSYKKHPKQL